MAAGGKIVSGDRELSMATMHERALRAARGLQEIGVAHGDAIAVYLRNDFPFFEAAYAANRLGAYLVPINWHFSGPEVAYILGDSGAKVLIAHADLLMSVRSHVPAACRVMCVETPPEIASAYPITRGARRVPTDAVRWDTWLEDHERCRRPPFRRPAA